jgi:hypothetical protein
MKNRWRRGSTPILFCSKGALGPRCPAKLDYYTDQRSTATLPTELLPLWVIGSTGGERAKTKFPLLNTSDLHQWSTKYTALALEIIPALTSSYGVHHSRCPLGKPSPSLASPWASITHQLLISPCNWPPQHCR